MAEDRHCATSTAKDQEKANQLILTTYVAMFQLSIVFQIKDWKRQSLNHISTRRRKLKSQRRLESAVEWNLYSEMVADQHGRFALYIFQEFQSSFSLAPLLTIKLNWSTEGVLLTRILHFILPKTKFSLHTTKPFHKMKWGTRSRDHFIWTKMQMHLLHPTEKFGIIFQVFNKATQNFERQLILF